MDKELYFGVDVSKKTLDLAYYDGETIDWKNAHIKVSNDDAGFKKIGSWVARVGKDFDTFLFCMEYTDSITKTSDYGWNQKNISMVWWNLAKCITSSQIWMMTSALLTVSRLTNWMLSE